jgi:site-specific DNA-methyltransferase (adenine-specific)
MTVTLHHGNCLDVMRAMPDNSVDSIVTDPPYGLGFMGKHWDHGVPGVDFWAEMLRILKPGGHLLSFGGSRTYHRMACAVEDAGFEIRDQIMWVYGSGFPKSHNGDWGGTALKPAHEPIVMARKPLIGTVEKNWKEHGTGALNIDGCRVEGGERPLVTSDRRLENNTYSAGLGGSQYQGVTNAGRWPANLIHDGSDEVLAAFPQAPGQQADVSGTAPSAKTSNVYGAMKRVGEPSLDSDNEGAVGFKMKPGARRLDAGSAARFFYCAKAGRKDRNEGLADPGPQFKHGTTLRNVENADTKGNNHPTVKPTDLMAYLCRLVTPPGGVVLDPFMGSGSTGKAAVREGFRFIGCDMQAEYVEIARARIDHELVGDLL